MKRKLTRGRTDDNVELNNGLKRQDVSELGSEPLKATIGLKASVEKCVIGKCGLIIKQLQSNYYKTHSDIKK